MKAQGLSYQIDVTHVAGVLHVCGRRGESLPMAFHIHVAVGCVRGGGRVDRRLGTHEQHGLFDGVERSIDLLLLLFAICGSHFLVVAVHNQRDVVNLGGNCALFRRFGWHELDVVEIVEIVELLAAIVCVQRQGLCNYLNYSLLFLEDILSKLFCCLVIAAYFRLSSSCKAP